MARGETTVVKTIHQRVRLNNSVNGNPRYRLHFSDGTTQSDSYCNYDVENLTERGATLELTLTRAGRVSAIRKLAPLQPMNHAKAFQHLVTDVELFLDGYRTRESLARDVTLLAAAVADAG